MYVAGAQRGSGVGRALLVAISQDLSAADLRNAEVVWVGPLGFYSKAADAWVARVFARGCRSAELPRLERLRRPWRA